MEIEKKGNSNVKRLTKIESFNTIYLKTNKVNTTTLSPESTLNPFNNIYVNPKKLLKLRVKRFDHDETLVTATLKKNFNYWLTQKDIVDIAQIEYNYFGGVPGTPIQFEVIGSLTHFSRALEAFIEKITATHYPSARLTLIINLNNNHWVSLVISYQAENFVGYFSDSKNNFLPEEYAQISNKLHIALVNLSPGFIQQQDGFNCGLWALENAYDLNQMIDQNQSIHWVINTLKRPRNTQYFIGKRIYFSEKLTNQPVFNKNNWSPFQDPNMLIEFSPQSTSLSSNFNPKRIKTLPDHDKKEKVNFLLSHYVETFMSFFTKELGNYHLLAKNRLLTEDALKAELKTGLTGALVGITIAQSLMGSIPSLTASARSMSSKYYGSENKILKITRIFSEVRPETLSIMLAEAAVDIFYSLESQFMQITDKAGEKIAIEKLAEDAVGRVFNALNDNFEFNRPISKELIEVSILIGPSEKYFKPNIKKARLKVPGYTLKNKFNIDINTSDLYEKTDLINFETDNLGHKFYVKWKYPGNQFGYRRLLYWEKDSHGLLKENYKRFYQVDLRTIQAKQLDPLISTKYNYILKNIEENQAEAQRILNKISTRYSSVVSIQHTEKKPIYFNLRSPVKNFSGRIEILKQLHDILMSERKPAIVSSYSQLSISPGFHSTDDLSLSHGSSGSQLSISGLGGIGKTQLALRYAELYAEHYDHNVLWIDAETKENLISSFHQLAKKLTIAIHDQYDQKKDIHEIIEEIYDYFSDRKSLFIFDNVDDYEMINAYLPKPRPDNKPTVLMTSRFSHWEGVANVLKLKLFTEHEAEELIKKSFHLQKIFGPIHVKTLNDLLQGLPLALQQALAYIKLRRITDPTFSFDDYITLYKEKMDELLTFDFSHYSNDPYVKTIFTTWSITLEKIKQAEFGEEAITILTIMAYLWPDHISTHKLHYFCYSVKNLNRDALNKSMYLLTSYSMISFDRDTQQSITENTQYSIHRLVQEVLRFKLEQNPTQFQSIVIKINLIMLQWEKYFKKSKERIFHSLHFLINILEHKELITDAVYKYPEKRLFQLLIVTQGRYCDVLMDLAYRKLTTKKFLEFLGTATAYYIKEGVHYILNDIFSYIDNKQRTGIFSEIDIHFFLNYYNSLTHPVFKLKKLSTVPSKKANQLYAKSLFSRFQETIVENVWKLNCPVHTLKRSICSFETQKKFKEIKKQQLQSHLKKINQVSRYVSSGMMTKDILSALSQGHFDEVALNFGLISSSIFLGTLSNSLLTEGKKLASGIHLFETYLGLENKNILHMLSNKDVLLSVKRKFLGKAMQMASPFVAKATSIYFAYNLNNEIDAYKMGNKEILPNIISNSIIVSIDGIEATIEGAEFFGIITGLSAVTGPLGEGIALLAWLGAEGYATKQHVEAIEKYVHLSRSEKFFEFLLGLLHQDPLEYVQLKAQNGQLLSQAIHFLKNNTAIQWYIFSALSFEEDRCNIRKVYLDRKINFTLEESNPDQPDEGNLFCKVAAPPPFDSKNAKTTSYVCHKALGATYTLNRTGNMTLVDLGEGEDEVIAFRHSPNLFMVNNGKKQYVGGDFGNIFDLQGTSITGQLQGGRGTDILLLDHFYPENSHYVLLDADRFLCGKNNLIQSVPSFCSSDERRIQINFINKIYGRKNKSDSFYLNQHICFIDGYGGENQDYPDSFFITDNASKNLTIVLRNNTFISVLPDSKISAIDYRIPSGEIGHSQIQYYFESATRHQLFFETSFQDINTLTFENNTAFVSVRVHNAMDKKTFSIVFLINISNSDSHKTKNSDQFYKKIYFRFNDLKITLTNSNCLYGQETLDNPNTLDEKISLYSTLATRLEKSFSIQLINNATLSIGQKNKHEIFYINSAYESHLVGNGGENVYTLLANNNTRFPLPKMTLYDIPDKDSNEFIELINSLDLRKIIKKYKQIYSDAVITSHVVASENDLILTVSNAVYFNTVAYPNDTTSFLPWITIQLKNALLNDTNWYQRIHVFLDNNPKNIVPLKNNFWALTRSPLVFSDDKKIIFLTHFDLEDETIVYVLKNSGDFSFFRHATDLILTNIFTSSIDYWTIIYYQFYQDKAMKRKALSAYFKFLNQEICLKNYQKEIEHAPSFQNSSELFLNNKNEIETLDYFKSIQVSPSFQENQQTQRHALLRHKRHLIREEKILVNTYKKAINAQKIPTKNNDYLQSQINEEDRILAIADNYFKKYDYADSKRTAYYNKSKININRKKIKQQKTGYFKAIQEKNVTVIKQNNHHLTRSENNNFNRNKKNTLELKKVNNPPHKLPTHSNLSKLKKESFFKITSLKKEKISTTQKYLSAPENFTPTIKTNAISRQLTYKKNQSRSKKSTLHSLSSSIEQPNLHNTLVFIDFIVNAYKGGSLPISYNKKAAKMIKKSEKIKNKINTNVFGISNSN